MTKDNTPTLEQIASYWKSMGWEIHPNALKEITRLIAQEANKAAKQTAIDELEGILNCWEHPSLAPHFLTDRIAQLTAEKDITT